MTQFDFQKNSADLKIPLGAYMRILKSAVLQTQADLAQAESALQAKDWPALQSISHRWKGDFANLRINELSEIARRMNDALKTAPDPDGLRADYAGFKAIFQDMQKTFEE